MHKVFFAYAFVIIGLNKKIHLTILIHLDLFSFVFRFTAGIKECLIPRKIVKETNPYWYDLSNAFAEVSSTKLKDTLNFRTNPR
jgi:hypothetical protein